mmetsp:Transcript_99932/g.158144  ORF Transcript_99932/g.158144 Transcript_99932/m.158144 type:complete len:204 (-) Transcript_99932:192-803(-)|eukprot:CAMPEP_0169138424 /NCGR_PEP_ID=MMETSP1015-20121227/42237_1 /TAXON_ID=342587 /ORGANISM="Karlodinium micrum, Strain CCMP2283" /LENGTH=203 /DNA_ID=CAMNT_0009203679 /DNA_START=43 /DNA_END=654 /DNA_ORIENTATION=+
MGNTSCNPPCASSQIENSSEDLQFDLNSEDGIQVHVEEREKARPVLPHLMLRTPRTREAELQKEEVAMAKVIALPHDFSSSTVDTTNTVTPAHRLLGIAPMASVDEEDGSATRSLEVVFIANGNDVPIQLYKRPLGAEFSKRSFGPTKVSKVHKKSYAEGLGLREGWVLKSIRGEDVSILSFEDTQTKLKAGLEKLPLSSPVA